MAAGTQSTPTQTDTDIDVASRNYQAYERARDAGHDKYVEQAVKQDNYFLGDQWEEAIRTKLEGEGRPALTINLILSAITSVLGQHAATRADIIFKPRRNAVQETADALTKLGLQIQDEAEYMYHEALMFADGIIQDRGFIDMRMNFDGNPTQGDIEMSAEDPIDILIDAGAKKYEPKTWREVIKTRWMTLDEVDENYGEELAKQVKESAADHDYSHDQVRYHQATFGDVDRATAMMTMAVEREIRRVRVIERQYYKITRVRLLVDPNTGDTREVPQNVSDAIVHQLAEQNGYRVIKRRGRKIRWTVTAANVVLHDAWSPYRSFTIIPFFPIFRRGKSIGLVRNLISPQDQLNKTESQMLHVVNTTANSGWSVEEGSLANMTPDDLEQRGAETGLVVIHRRNRTPPKKIEPNQIPTGLDRLGSKASSHLREISGVGGLLAQADPELSGVTLSGARSNSLLQLQTVFDNLNRTRKLVAEKMLELVQDFYTETRFVRVTDWENPNRAEEEVVVNGLSPEGHIINDITVGEYDMVVSSAPTRDSFEESQFAESVELRSAGIMIPDHHIIAQSHLANKFEIADEVKQMQGFGEMSPEQQALQNFQMQAEIQNIQLDMQEKQMKIAKLEGEATLYMAKAQSLAGAAREDAERRGVEMRQQVEQLQADLMKQAATLQNKLELAQMHINANREKTLYTETSKRVNEMFKARAQRKVGRGEKGNSQ